ncbi:MAG: DUF4913 domain-containing protein [Candidatus Saccharibacteria bacterium]|nr:DUF4913 domain-containing protein [Microbacteriaceae bacterium]
MRKNLRYSYGRAVARPGRGDYRWQDAWWKSEEAISRIESLWRTWERARLDPSSGISDWWLNHCDRHMQKAPVNDGAVRNLIGREQTRRAAPVFSTTSWIL